MTNRALSGCVRGRRSHGMCPVRARVTPGHRGPLQARWLALGPPGISAASRSQGSVYPQEQLRQAEEPLGATGAWADGLTGVCCLQCPHGRCLSQAATPRLAGAQAGSPQTLNGLQQDAKRVPQRPRGVGWGSSGHGEQDVLQNHHGEQDVLQNQPGAVRGAWRPEVQAVEVPGEGEAAEVAVYLRGAI